MNSVIDSASVIRLVKNLVDAELTAGRHKVVWDGRDERGDRVSSGIYVYTIRTEKDTATKKVVLLK